jgi:hypothetical protein
MASDPFEREAYREWLLPTAVLLSLFALTVAVLLFLLRSGYDFRHPKSVDATVVRLGMSPDAYFGDGPILTVRFGDGSIRQIATSWNAVKWCKPGSNISLLQVRNNIRVALRGCARHG